MVIIMTFGGTRVVLGACVAVIEAGHILLTQREDFEAWCLPGGHVENGESAAQAAVREVREETGLEVELTSLVGIYFRSAGWVEGSMHVISFAARPVGGTLHPQPGEVLEARYFHADTLPKPLFWGQRQRIRDALSGVAGSRVWSQYRPWPFAAGLKRQDIYSLRDQSGLSRQAYYMQHFPAESEIDTLEVGENPLV